MVSHGQVAAVIDRIRPTIQSDGGHIELIAVIDNKAKVRLTGNCVVCPSARMTLYMGIETALRKELPEFAELLLE